MKQNQQINTIHSINIQRIIKQCYNPNELYLDLLDYVHDWINVLGFQDWSKLEALQLGSCEIDDVKIKIFGKLRWPKLQTLHLGNNELTVLGLRNLLTQKYPKLTYLKLWNNKISDEGMQLLTATRLLPELEELFVDENQISWVGLINIVDVKWKKRMRLHLNKNLIGSTGIKLLIKAHLPILSILSLKMCGIGNEGTKHLIKGEWPSLTALGLWDNNISCDGCQAITMGNYKNLESLWLTCNDQIDSVIFLGFVCGSYSKTKITTKKISNSKLKQSIENIFQTRFYQ